MNIAKAERNTPSVIFDSKFSTIIVDTFVPLENSEELVFIIISERKGLNYVLAETIEIILLPSLMFMSVVLLKT